MRSSTRAREHLARDEALRRGRRAPRPRGARRAAQGEARGKATGIARRQTRSSQPARADRVPGREIAPAATDQAGARRAPGMSRSACARTICASAASPGQDGIEAIAPDEDVLEPGDGARRRQARRPRWGGRAGRPARRACPASPRSSSASRRSSATWNASPIRAPRSIQGSGSWPAGERAHLRRGDEQRAGLGAVIGGEVDLPLAFPALPGADAVRHAGPAAPATAISWTARTAILHGGAGQHLEGQDDQADRRSAPPAARKRRDAPRACPAAVSASSKQGRSSCTRLAQWISSSAAAAASESAGPVVAAGHRDRQQDRRPDPRAAGRAGIVERMRELRGGMLRPLGAALERAVVTAASMRSVRPMAVSPAPGSGAMSVAAYTHV